MRQPLGRRAARCDDPEPALDVLFAGVDGELPGRPGELAGLDAVEPELHSPGSDPRAARRRPRALRRPARPPTGRRSRAPVVAWPRRGRCGCAPAAGCRLQACGERRQSDQREEPRGVAVAAGAWMRHGRRGDSGQRESPAGADRLPRAPPERASPGAVCRRAPRRDSAGVPRPPLRRALACGRRRRIGSSANRRRAPSPGAPSAANAACDGEDWPPRAGRSGPTRRRAPRAAPSRRGSARGRGSGRRSTCRSRRRRAAGGRAPARRRARSSRSRPPWRASRARARRGRRPRRRRASGRGAAGLRGGRGARRRTWSRRVSAACRPAVAQQQHGERDVGVDVVRREHAGRGSSISAARAGRRHGQQIGGEAGVGRPRSGGARPRCRAATRHLREDPARRRRSARWVRP